MYIIMYASSTPPLLHTMYMHVQYMYMVYVHYSNHYQVAELLLDAGSDVNVTGYGGSTPIHIAAALGHCRLLKLFLNQPNPDVNSKVIIMQAYKCTLYMYMCGAPSRLGIQVSCAVFVRFLSRLGCWELVGLGY